MRKSFLRTCIVLGLFSIFLFTQISFSFAQERNTSSQNTPWYQTLINWTPAGLVANNVFGVNLGRAVTNSNSGSGVKDNFVENAMQTFAMFGLINGSKLVTWGVGFAGYIFDETLKQTTQYPDWLNVGVSNSWKIIRDITNMILVFSLLYLGIKTILEGQGFADKKTLISIIIAALLINFSLVFVKDIAFGISNNVGNQILTASGANNTNGRSSSASAQLMSIVNPQQALGKYPNWGASNIAEQPEVGWDKIFSMTGQMLMLTTVTLSLTVIFIGASIVLLYRFVIFIVLMIFSPFGLVSMQIPWLKKYGDDWFDQLKKQTLFFPAFVLILYIVLLIVSSLAAAEIGGGTLRLDGSQNAIFEYLFNFMLIIAFTMLILILPGKIGAAGADMMTNVGNWTTKKIKSIPRRTLQRTAQVGASGVARGGRLILGKGLGGALTSKSLKDKAQQKGVGGFFARQVVKTGDGLKNKTYDIRNVDAVKKSDFGKGMGTSIESWTKAVKTKKDEIEKKKKDEMKMFGFDKIKVDEVALEEAKQKRDKLQDMSENYRKKYLENPKDTRVKAIYEETKKKLELAEIEVGKIKKPGDAQYQENVVNERRNLMWMQHVPVLRAHHDRIVGIMNATTIRNTAYTETKDDLYKSFQKDGLSEKKKKEIKKDKELDEAVKGKPKKESKPKEKDSSEEKK